MPYMGELKRQIPFTIYVSASLTGECALTIIKINQRGGMNARVYTIAPGANPSFDELLGARITRVILQCSPPLAGQMNVTILQVTTNYAASLTSDSELVFNAVP